AYQRLEINTGFSAYMRQPFPLYGAQGLRRNTFTLGGNGYVEGTLYFPRGDLESVSGKIFELDLGSPDLRDTILLRFKIP
ncbi:MAG: hypothetical protein OEQ13_09555, partial [Acidobacteriota bacterium]|nr:hypothetical protein [Acidobacteriota bacterium]